MEIRRRTTGFTLIELLVVMSIIALLLSILMPALGRARETAMLQKDSSRIRSIHSGWVTWSASNNENYPTPGFVNRNAWDQGNGVQVQVKGRGPEDKFINTTDNVHSLCVIENLYNTDALICDNEPNPNVYVMENYDYDQRDIPADVYWDNDFNVDLNGDGNNDQEGCHLSYASIPLIGERKSAQWKASGTSEFAILANRGPQFGSLEEFSMTYEIHGGGRTWNGNVCWQDNHMSYEETLFPEMSIYRTIDGHVIDNIFNIDCVTGVCHLWGGDSFLTIVSELDEAGEMYPYMLNPEMEWDE